MSKVIRAVLAAASAALLVMLFAPASFAASLTTVTCKTPVSQVATGYDITTSPRWTIVCNGGSSAPGIMYFAFRISDGATVAELLEAQLASYLKIHGTAASIMILSDLADISGASWGCGASNCRLIAYLYGD
jgi:hypothetical protein